MPKKKQPAMPMAIYTIAEFCRTHGISRATYYRLRHQGLAPREMRVGRHRRISVEAAQAWRLAREIDPLLPR